jgi:hypothetical protein
MLHTPCNHRPEQQRRGHGREHDEGRGTHLIAAGPPNPAIASRIGLAGNHISSIFLKMQVATRAEAIARAWQAGLGGG